MSRDPVVAAIDIGTTKVCTLIGQVQRELGVQILGVGLAHSRGLRRGTVINIGEAVTAIRESIDKAERSSGVRIGSAFIGITGNHVDSLNNRGVVAVSGVDRVITAEDVGRAIESARAVNIPSNREIVHVIPRSYSIDGQEGVDNPIGMHGFRLDVETHIVTAGSTAIQNLTKCIQQAGIEIEDIVLDPIASSEAVLTTEEQEMGVILADIGGGTTDVGIFVEGAIYHSASIAVGGHQLTKDLAYALQAPLAAAEEVKARFGHAIADSIDPEATIDFETFGSDGSSTISRRYISEVIQARTEEIFERIHNEIQRSGYNGLLPAGLILAGGTANLPGIDVLARGMLALPVRIGRPRHLQGLGESLQDPAYATAVGLLLWGLARGDVEGRISNRRTEQAVDVYRRLTGWIRELLPQ